MAGISLNDALAEIEHVRNECLGLIHDLEKFCPPNQAGEFPPAFRLLATPMLYSAWERCFTLCNGIALRLIRERTSHAHKLPPHGRALWLQAAGFFQTFSRKVFEAPDAGDPDARAPKPGRFRALSDFLRSLDTWSMQPLDPILATDELVMTFSNVNPKVVELNAEAVGIVTFTQFQQLKFGRLHDLVGRRNEIGHGAIIKPPDNAEFCDLKQFTLDIVRSYCDVYAAWLVSQYPPPSTLAKLLEGLNPRRWLGGS